ncbi:MAG: hypothetical protein Q8L28_01380, partial [bacterium]|nr:hypothetical protein [bacterium]
MKIWQKIIAIVSTFAVLINSLGAPLAVLAQEATPTPEPIPVAEETASPSPEPTMAPTEEPTVTPEVSPNPEASPTPSPSPWTFEKVELNKEYIAPQNSEVKLTFTKLPTPAGSIKIEEITLTEEQILQIGSLSDKAYDITSDMADGSFTYNLSLPIPESSKGKSVEVKFAEELSNIGSAEKVENIVTSNDASVSVENLNHFTIFVVSSPALIDGACLTATGGTPTCYATIQAAIDNASDGDTINFTSDITATATVVVNRAVTINGGGFTLTFTGLENVV